MVNGCLVQILRLTALVGQRSHPFAMGDGNGITLIQYSDTVIWNHGGPGRGVVESWTPSFITCSHYVYLSIVCCLLSMLLKTEN